jgi:glycosyltransferase involved in cell wall biosynthesis
MPKISVCIPTYNRAHFLSYAVNSVLSQTYTDFEIIICDDGSTDDTPQLVNQWNDERIRYVRHLVNGGRSKNMRSGFEAATGTYFIKFDDDDALTPEFLEKTAAVLDTNNNVDFVCTDHWIIDQNNERSESATKENSVKWGKDQLEKGVISNLLEETFVNQSLQVGSTLFRRDCLQEVDFMRPEADGCEDFDLLVRLAIAKKQGYFLPEILMEYRIHGGQTSLKQNIHFLKAKLFCLNSYNFAETELEKLRILKLHGTKQSLALKLIENGENSEGRKLLKESSEYLGSSRKNILGLVLSYLPKEWRDFALQNWRKARPKDYSDKVREATN